MRNGMIYLFIKLIVSCCTLEYFIHITTVSITVGGNMEPGFCRKPITICSGQLLARPTHIQDSVGYFNINGLIAVDIKYVILEFFTQGLFWLSQSNFLPLHVGGGHLNYLIIQSERLIEVILSNLHIALGTVCAIQP